MFWQFDKVTEIKFKVWFEVAPETVTVAKPLLFKVTGTFDPEPILYTTVAFGVPVIVKVAVFPEHIGEVALTEAVGMALTTTVSVVDLTHPLPSVPVTV